jgi:rRNA small subunit pseudouridine methyltransferase Nep1
MGLASLLDSRSTGFPWKEKAFTMFTNHPTILWRKPNLGAHPDLPRQFHVSLGEGRLHVEAVDGLLEEDVDAFAGYLPDFSPVSPSLHLDEPLVHAKAFPPMIKFFPAHCYVFAMLHLAFVEAALERTPRALWGHPSVVNRARKAGKHPGQILLDRTYHHRAMLKLENDARRGRPDILHVSLLGALGTPLNKEACLKTYVHTRDDHLIHLNPEVRLPKNYARFIGLMEQLYEVGTIPQRGVPLLTLTRGLFRDLLADIKPSYVLAFSRMGRPKSLQTVVEARKAEEDLMVVVGAFPRGPFSKAIVDAADEVVSIDFEPLEAWVVASRIIYAYEQALGLPAKRLRKR